MTTRWFDRETLDRRIPEEILSVNVVLDIGCGIRPQTFFKPELHILCEPWEEYVEILQNRFVTQQNILVLKGSWEDVLPFFPNQSVDSIFLLDVIEHLEKEEGLRLMTECERLARKQIIIFTPLGFMPQDHDPSGYDAWGLQGADWQVHKSGWTPEDFDPSWSIFAAKTFHTANAKGDLLASPQGAFYAIKNIRQSDRVSFPTKLAILSDILPPSLSGRSVMLYRLLRPISPESYCLLSRQNYDPFLSFQNSDNRLPARYFSLPGETTFYSLKRRGLRQICRGINFLMVLIQRSFGIRTFLKREKCGGILICSGDFIDFPSGYLTSRLCGVPFYLYLFDPSLDPQSNQLYRRFLRRIKARVLQKASKVIVSNEFLQEELQRCYGIACQVIRHACENNLSGEKEIAWPFEENRIKIVYTGVIHRVQYDAFRNLIKAIEQWLQPELELHVYTIQQERDLERENPGGAVAYHFQFSPTHIREIQRRADILYLPLAFDPRNAEDVKTSAPVKMGEYLHTGRPILVHAPSDSFLAWYFKKYQCGVVVDQNDLKILQNAIRWIIEDKSLREQLKENALSRAKTDFDLEVARLLFRKVFQNHGEQMDGDSINDCPEPNGKPRLF